MSGRSDPTRYDSRNSVIFSLKNRVGGLAQALQVFQVSRYHYIKLFIVLNMDNLISKQT